MGWDGIGQNDVSPSKRLYSNISSASHVFRGYIHLQPNVQVIHPVNNAQRNNFPHTLFHIQNIDQRNMAFFERCCSFLAPGLKKLHFVERKNN